MKYALVDGKNKVVNLIAYDGKAPYTPPAGTTLAQVDDSARIGDAANPQ